MHQAGANNELREAIYRYASERMDMNPAPLDGPKSRAELEALAGSTITESGLGGTRALEIFEQTLAPATISTDHPNFLSFIPAAPTEAATLFDLVVSASSIYGGSWTEGAGAVFAENQVLEFLAKEAGLPDGAGGVFVQGGTLGNLSALVVARDVAERKHGHKTWAIICSSEAHSSIKAVAKVMGVEVVKADAAVTGSLRGQQAKQAVHQAIENGLTPFAIVGTGGTTNFGIIDQLGDLALVAKEFDLWFHVDGAYGLAGMLVEELKPKYAGLELADSFIVDPHKWLFSPFDACALVYREPKLAKTAHIQHGEYLETLNQNDDWNPSDFAFNLTRRVRGLPLWFSLATHGVAAYRSAIKMNLDLTKQIATEIRSRPYLRLVREPELSVVVFEREGWSNADYEKWSKQLLDSQFAFVVPSSHLGKPNTRFAIVNPTTKLEDLVAILDTME
ncbi:MAG TPA: aspartate aminotransferase family protein [Candidatus Aquiluna sp.]|jgi:L-2,4-diaminobutyrate decarboxylase|nr:aspartate aminotransferase family protein [Aquiluna sp.]